MCYVRIVLFVFGWLSTSVCQMAPFGIESLLFGGLGAFPPPQPIRFPLGLGGLFGQGQFAPSMIGMPPSMGGFPMGPLPFPLFPTPCDMGCNQGGLFFANINVNQGASPGMPGGGMPGMPPGGMPGMPPPGGMPGGGIPTTGRPPTGGLPGGTPSPTRPPTGLPPTTMPPRPPQAQSPNLNAQVLYFVPNWSPYQSLSWPPLSMPFYG